MGRSRSPGVWDYRAVTPLERPANFGDRQFLNDEEVARLEADAAKRLDSPPDDTPTNLVHAPSMTIPAARSTRTIAPSLIVGSAGRPRAAADRRGAGPGGVCARRGSGRDGGADGPEPQLARALHHLGPAGRPSCRALRRRRPHLQGPGYVTITHEMVHDTRLVPLDGRPGALA